MGVSGPELVTRSERLSKYFQITVRLKQLLLRKYYTLSPGESVSTKYENKANTLRSPLSGLVLDNQ